MTISSESLSFQGKEVSPTAESYNTSTPLDKINLHVRGGHVIPWQQPDNTTQYRWVWDTDRQTEAETDGDRQAVRDTHTQRQRERHRGRETERQRHTERAKEEDLTQVLN